MMTVTFLDHSGFLAELPSAALLFDWWRGELPPLPRQAAPGVCQPSPPGPLHPRDLRPGRRAAGDPLPAGGTDPPDRQEPDQMGPLRRDCRKMPGPLGGERVAPLPASRWRRCPPPTRARPSWSAPTKGRSSTPGSELVALGGRGPPPGTGTWRVNFKRYAEPLRGRRIDLAHAASGPPAGGGRLPGAGVFSGDGGHPPLSAHAPVGGLRPSRRGS